MKERPEMNEHSLLDVREAAALLGISPGSLYHWLSQGRIPFVRLGPRCVRFRQSDIEHWVAERVVPSQDPLCSATGKRLRKVPNKQGAV